MQLFNDPSLVLTDDGSVIVMKYKSLHMVCKYLVKSHLKMGDLCKFFSEIIPRMQICVIVFSKFLRK